MPETSQVEKPAAEEKPSPKDQIVVTHHSFSAGEASFAYTVTAGTIVLKEESQKKGDQAGEAEGE